MGRHTLVHRRDIPIRPRRACPSFQAVILHSVLEVLIKLDGENQVVKRRRLIIAYTDVNRYSRSARHSDF